MSAHGQCQATMEGEGRRGGCMHSFSVHKGGMAVLRQIKYQLNPTYADRVKDVRQLLHGTLIPFSVYLHEHSVL